jgi:hypothetical protein
VPQMTPRPPTRIRYRILCCSHVPAKARIIHELHPGGGIVCNPAVGQFAAEAASRRHLARPRSIWSREAPQPKADSSLRCAPLRMTCHPEGRMTCHPERSEGSAFLRTPRRRWQLVLQRGIATTKTRLSVSSVPFKL